MSDDHSKLLQMIIDNQSESSKETKKDLQGLRSSVDLLASDMNLKIDNHVKEDIEEFKTLREGQTKIQLTMAKLAGIRATLVYLVPGAAFIAWLMFKTIFGIED
jgi:hypothetical protein